MILNCLECPFVKQVSAAPEMWKCTHEDRPNRITLVGLGHGRPEWCRDLPLTLEEAQDARHINVFQ